MTEYEEILQKYWHYAQFRPLQQEIIASVCSGKDTLGLMPTGGGKSITFQVAALSKPGICLVVTPLIALMKDQVDNLKRRQIKAAAIYTGMNRKAIEQAYNNCLLGNYKFLYISPERLKTKQFLSFLQQANVNLLTVDESHCISQWGYDFRPSYLEIANIRELIPDVPVLALTATATPDVVKDIQDKLQFKEYNCLSKSFERHNLTYTVQKRNDKIGALLQICSHTQGTGIVYVATRKDTKEIAYVLQQNGFVADYYHGGLDAKTRTQKQEIWMRTPNEIMVSTNAFGMGIDKPDVRFVVHLHIPESLEAYFQEAGRAGRDEKDSCATLIYNDADVEKIIENFKKKYPSPDFIRTVYEALYVYFGCGMYEGGGQIRPFDVVQFCQKSKLPYMETMNALAILEEEEYIVINNQEDASSKFQFTLLSGDLYRYGIEHKKLESFINFLLRTYSGISSEMTSIDEEDLARRANTSVETIVALLNRLANVDEIAIYQPAQKLPLMVLYGDRREKKDVHLNEQFLQERKERQRKRLDAIIQYVTSENKCRNIMLLQYFGETSQHRCGKCDVCLTRNDVEISSLQFDYIVEDLKKQIGTSSATVSDIIRNSSFHDEKLITNVIKYLLDKGKIRYVNGASLQWVSSPQVKDNNSEQNA